MRKLRPAFLAASLAASLTGVCSSAHALDFNGYFRAGTASNSEHGQQTCFGLNGAGAKYRLGNECEVYGELMFTQDVKVPNDGVYFRTLTMLSLKNTMSDDTSLKSSNSDVGLPQIALEAINLPELNGGIAWIGRRYYKREDIHINDFFYWNPSGLGGGIEDYQLGGVKLSYALLRDDQGSLNHGTPNAATRHDFQARGIAINPGGELQFGLNIVAKDSADPSHHSGWSFTTQHVQKWADGSQNKLALQYGVGPGTSMGNSGTLTNDSSFKRTRLVDGYLFKIDKMTDGMVTAVYQKDNSAGQTQTWTSLGGRLVYGFTQHVKLAVELGHDQVTPPTGPSASLTKLTIAPTLTAGPGLFTRPDLRLFYTYARWNDAARNSAVAGDPMSASGVFGSKSSGSTLGLQAEIWW